MLNVLGLVDKTPQPPRAYITYILDKITLVCFLLYFGVGGEF